MAVWLHPRLFHVPCDVTRRGSCRSHTHGARVVLPCSHFHPAGCLADAVWAQTGSDVDGERGQAQCPRCHAAFEFAVADEAPSACTSLMPVSPSMTASAFTTSPRSAAAMVPL